ncbi:hypothetical protein SAMN06296065_10223 [Novosphingobium panipatense]|jgi:hypothetical protein|uniref:Uncharacterized protein n=2 Tax=Novosphingobium panipatense TaxID=428991 RepID=A0ABY1Q0R5_9SPHN|nr:hypothetical protein SAMN06296065_10223 [Novosphingobium panipatense]
MEMMGLLVSRIDRRFVQRSIPARVVENIRPNVQSDAGG